MTSLLSGPGSQQRSAAVMRAAEAETLACGAG
jgi:hypothetical protein